MISSDAKSRQTPRRETEYKERVLKELGFDVFTDGHAEIMSRESFEAIQEMVRRKAGAFSIEGEARTT